MRSIEKAEARLRKRRQVVQAGSELPRSLTYDAIASHAGLFGPSGRPNRDRIRQFEKLMALDWPLRKSHPDFPAKPGFVRLPTPDEAARLQRSR